MILKTRMSCVCLYVGSTLPQWVCCYSFSDVIRNSCMDQRRPEQLLIDTFLADWLHASILFFFFFLSPSKGIP